MIDNTRVPPTRTTPTRRSKKRGTKTDPQTRLLEIQHVERLLKQCLRFAKSADTPMLAGRIRAAIKSAGGAGRHARLAPYREARQAKGRNFSVIPNPCQHPDTLAVGSGSLKCKECGKVGTLAEFREDRWGKVGESKDVGHGLKLTRIA